MPAFAQWRELPVLQRAKAPLPAEQIVAILRTLGTSLVIVDEVHNLKTNRQAGTEAASTLRQLPDRLDVTFLYAGVQLPTTDLFADEMGRQIKARMILHQMTPYSIGRKRTRES